MSQKHVLPVIHYLDDALALENAAIAFEAGASGVFVIAMEGDDDPVIPAARLIKARWPEKLIGVNLLDSAPAQALEASLAAGLDATWTDRPGVSSDYVGAEAFRVSERLKSAPSHLFFGSVAFKYQALERHPDVAARRAKALGMIPTTSGTATGEAPTPGKTDLMKAAIGETPLALASGITPANIGLFLPSTTYFLVATGISSDEHRLDPQLCSELMARVRTWVEVPC
jgi:hypothetical protein